MYLRGLNMKYIIYTILSILILTVSMTAHSSIPNVAGDENDFDDIILLIADGTLNSPDLFSLMNPDPDTQGLREGLNWDDVEVEQFRVDAELFFKNRFGFDFTQIDEDINNVKVLPGVGQLLFVRFSEDVGYKAIYTGKKNVTKKVDAMGYVVIITDPGVLYHGDFGGEAGVPAIPGEIAAFGLYNIGGKQHDNKDNESDRHFNKHKEKKHKKNEVIFFQQSTPGRYTPEGLIGIFCEISSAQRGNGNGEGTTGLVPLPDGRAHVFIRNVLTFPGRIN